MNTFKTMVLLTGLTLIFIFLGGILAGRQGMVFAFFFACVMNFVSYWFSDKIVLAIYGAQRVTEAEAPRLYAITANLAQKMEIPMPKLHVIPSETPNAFATGRNPQNAVVACTQGILRVLSEEELEGVLAHELAHVKHRDILISSLVATFAGAITMLADMARWALIFRGGRDSRERGANPLIYVVTLIVAPIAALLIQLAISRSREYAADEKGARLAGNPLQLASALRKLESHKPHFPFRAHPSTAHLFIVNPLRGGFLLALFSTHPATQERVRRLEQMAKARS